MCEKSILTAKEWIIMQVLWERGHANFSEIRDYISEKGWSRHLVASFLKRMETKGSIRVEYEKGTKIYYPILDEEKAAKTESSVLAKNFTKKSTFLFVTNMVKEKNLSEQQLDDLMKIIEEEREKCEKEEKNE